MPTKAPRAGHRLDRDRLEARELRRPDEGLPPRAAPLVEPVHERDGAGMGRRRRDRLGR